LIRLNLPGSILENYENIDYDFEQSIAFSILILI
jgi:hypothetical protein